MANELDQSIFDILNYIPFHNETTEIISLDKATCNIIADMGYYDDMFKGAFYQKYFGTSSAEKSHIKIELALFNTQFNGVNCQLLTIRFNDKNLKHDIPLFPKPADFKKHLPFVLFLDFENDGKQYSFAIKLNSSLFVYKYIGDVIDYLKDAKYLNEQNKYPTYLTKTDIKVILSKLSKSKIDKKELPQSYFYQYGIQKENIYNGLDASIVSDLAPFVNFVIKDLASKMCAPKVEIVKNHEKDAISLSKISDNNKNPLHNIHFLYHFGDYCRMYESCYDNYNNYFYIQERTFLTDLTELDEDKIYTLVRAYIGDRIDPNSSAIFYLNGLLFTSFETATITKRIIDDIFAKALTETLSGIDVYLDANQAINDFKKRLEDLMNGINERRDNLVSYIEHRYGQDIEVI